LLLEQNIAALEGSKQKVVHINPQFK